jgi:hypothetical protein
MRAWSNSYLSALECESLQTKSTDLSVMVLLFKRNGYVMNKTNVLVQKHETNSTITVYQFYLYYMNRPFHAVAVL